MKRNRIFILTILFIIVTIEVFVFAINDQTDKSRFISYKVDTRRQEIKLYWKNDNNENFRSIQNLKLWLEKNKKTLVFAMNAGMYKHDNSPQGLFIEKQTTLSPLDTSRGNGNFYLKPNGVFYLTTDNIPIICNTINFKDNGKIKYATQSGPMLLVDGLIHSAFKEKSSNLNI